MSIEIALSQRKRINFQLQGKTKQNKTNDDDFTTTERLGSYTIQSQPFHLNRRNT